MTEVEKVAQGLTERQRLSIINARWIGQGVVSMCVVDYTEPWTEPVATFLTLGSDQLNDLGLAVREHLLKAKP